MNTIEQAFWEAVLADIVYVDGLVPNMTKDTLAAKIEFRVSKPLADLIGERFEVVAVKSDPTSDYQGVVFRDKNTNQLYLANRGTESLTDIFVADVDLAVVSGVATRQTAAMVNWWLQISRAAGTSVQQIAASASQNFVAQSAVDATGEIAAALAASGGKVRVVGHSLGGHLTSVFASLFSDQVIHSSTFNGAGLFSTGAALNFTTWIVNFMSGEPLALAASLVGSQVHLPGSGQDNFYAYNGLSLTTNSLTFTQLGERIGIFNERSTVFGTDVPNHFLYKLTDTLALMVALEKLDPTASVAKLDTAFEASSSTMVASNENMLDALRRLILGKEVAITPAIDDGGDWKTSVMPPERTQYHQNLSDLRNSPAFQSLTGKVTLTLSNADLASSARDQFSNLLSLLTLSPFVMKATTGNEAAVDTALQANWQTEYAAWQTDVERIALERAAGRGVPDDLNYSDTYLRDRAAMLDWKVRFNQKNVVTTLTNPHEDVLMSQWQYFKDSASGDEIVLGKPPAGQDDRHQILFGSDGDETLAGLGKDDHLYGGGGDDTLDGAAGADRLEGNAGSDILTGGEGRDTLYGGAGADILEGGKENDLLNGGTGDDTYKLTSGDGWDWIEDSDGQGHIELDGITLGAGEIEWKADNIWQQTDAATGKTITYSIYDRTEGGETFKILAIQYGSDGLWVKHWQDGQLGISLPGPAEAEVYAVGVPKVKENETSWHDSKHIILDGKAIGRVELSAVGDYGEVWCSGKLNGNEFANGLYSYDDDDELYGLSGRDVLISYDGDDTLDGGDDDDALSSGDGNDVLFGGAGNDVLSGGIGEDVLDGGKGDDILIGGGSDTAKRSDWNVTRTGTTILFNQFCGSSMLAGDGADLLKGGEGNDTLWGGERGDHLYGDADDDELTGDSGGDHLDGGDGDDKLFGDGAEFANPLRYTAPENQGNDVLDGGAGNDFLSGDGGSDELHGGDGNDRLVGDVNGLSIQYHGTDYLDGGNGNDSLIGYGKDDTLFGGAGDDLLDGDTSDIESAEHGNDWLDGGEGNDTLGGSGGDDTLFGGNGNDQLFGDGDDIAVDDQGGDYLDGEDGDDYLRGYGGADTLIGGAGADCLDGEDGGDFLEGNEGVDSLHGGAGDDTLCGGEGTDILVGGEGDDVYLFSSGDGEGSLGGVVEAVIDEGGANTIVFEAASPGSLSVCAVNDSKDLLIKYGAGDYLVVVDGPAGAIQTYQIGDTTLTTSQLIGRYSETTVIAVDGDGRQIVSGGNAVDVISVNSTGATVSGGFGDDTITAVGKDATILYNKGDGNDQVVATGSGCVLRLGDGITLADLALKGSTGLLGVLIGREGAGSVSFAGFDAADPLSTKPVERVEFSDGSSITYAQLLALGFELPGTEGDDLLTGGAINDHIAGGLGNDTLSGLAGNDTLEGGAGNDLLIGGAGDDTYVWNLGDGQEVIDNTDGNAYAVDTLRIGAGPDDLVFLRSDEDLLVRMRNSTEQVRVKNHFAGAAIDSVVFADGTAWGGAAIESNLTVSTGTTTADDVFSGTAGSDLIDGLAGDDLLSGLAGGDLLIGGAGRDTLSGGPGEDTLDGRADGAPDLLQGDSDGDVYLFGRGSGADVITEAGDATSTDVLRLDAGILPSEIRVTRSGNDAVLEIVGTSDRLTIAGAYGANAGQAARIERIEFADGTVWDEQAIRQQILTGMATGDADFLNGFDGDDSICGLGGNDVLQGNAGNDSLNGGAGMDNLYGDEGDDVLEGGGGGDVLRGGNGNDTYLFGRESGSVTVYESQEDAGGNADTVVFGPGIAAEDVVLSQSGNTNLRIDIRLSSDSLLVSGFLATPGSAGKIERFVFEDGTIWTPETIMAMFTAGTPGSDTLSGFVWNDTIDGAGGDDTIRGNAGNDSIEGGDGNDMLYGDEYSPSSPGHDTLHGGAGKDVLNGGRGNDDYVFLRGDGADRIVETEGSDRVLFGEGILPGQIALFRNGDDLVVTLDGATQNVLTIEKFHTSNSIESFVFSGGTTWDLAQVQAMTTSGELNAMTGTLADDTFVVDNAKDTITEGLDQGNDIVMTSVDYVLPPNVENLTATGYLDLKLTGNALDNTIIGNLGNNVLSGGDGGVDTLKGGQGDDSYNIGFTALVVELPGEGDDTITVSASSSGYSSYTMPDSVENMVMKNNYAALYGTGNSLDNTISIQNNRIASCDYGSNGTRVVSGNTIDGGAGADRMYCSGGGTFYVDNVGDTVAGNGLLNVISTVDYALPDRGYPLGSLASILTLAGSDAISAKGSSESNILDGRQNLAANVLEGGAGNDKYYVGANDIIVEEEDGGVDTLMAYVGDSAQVYLPQYVENIELLGGNNPANLHGNDVANILKGNAGANAILGYGGNDTINGGDNWGDTLDGGDGDDSIYGNGTLLGGAGNDSLTSSYVSVLTGGTGNDTLTGNGLQDTYVFARGDGQDIVLDRSLTVDSYGNPISSNDTIEFVGDLNPNEILLSRSGDDLLVAVLGSDDRITVTNHFAPDTATTSFRMDRIRFADGTEWSASAIDNRIARGNANTATELSDVFGGSSGEDTILASGGDDLASGGAGDDVLEGGDGNDVLYGNSGDDTLAGGTGDDMLCGGVGADTYRFGRGAGVDTVIDPVNGAEIDTILIDAEVSPVQVVVSKGGLYDLDLILSIVDDPARLVLKNFAMLDASSGSAKRVQFADGTVWDSAMLVERTGSLFGSAANDSLVGTANADKMSGLAGNDSLEGLGGDDLLDGGAGADTMVGGSGDDMFVVDDAGDVVVETEGGGTDTVCASITCSLASNVEQLELLGDSAIDGTGNTLDNILVGNSGDNVLSGGSGADTLIGRAGNDTYGVDSAGDVVTEDQDEGLDTVVSSISWTLGANIENLTLAGTAAINGTGNSLNNVLVGNSAANVLKGGAGNDTYYVSTGDTVTEASGAGTDTVVADVSWTLGSNIERLTLAGTAAINGTGNTLANTLVGNSANNTLSGGTGADTLIGGAGNDTYVVDNAGDVVTELAGEGTDQVNSSVTTTLSANIENLTLTGTSAIKGTGNALDNLLTGNSANNTLTGGDGNDTLNGGSGSDTMVGGLGDDTYVVNIGTDVVTEAANAGIDTVQSSVTLTLAANAEALFLTGASAINGTGNTLNNLVRGNTAANTLNGGTGNDLLEGGAGNDTLTDTSGTALFNGGAGTDKLTGGAGAELFLGGLGNDTLTTGAGNDVILFNKGDGQDTFAAGGTGSDTLSLGGNFAYSDLAFSKSSNDLVLKMGATDQITFKNWYAATPSKPVVNLQVIAEAMAGFAQGGSNPLLDQKVENFNFTSLVGAFDAARAADANLTSWALANALATSTLGGSDSAAIGGDLAYQYGKNGTLAGIGLTAAQEVIGASGFGTQSQTLRPLESLQTGSVRLS